VKDGEAHLGINQIFRKYKLVDSRLRGNDDKIRREWHNTYNVKVTDLV